MIRIKQLFVFFAIVITCFSGAIAAENELKRLDVDRITTDRDLFVDRFSAIHWGGSENPEMYYVRNNSLIRYTLKTKKTDTVLNLDKFNKSVMTSISGIETFKRLPYIVGCKDGDIVMMFNKAYYNYNIKSGAISLYCSLPEDATNFAYNRNSGDIAYTKENNVYVLKDGVKFAVTKDQDPGIVNGQVVHRNEFGINKGIFWAPSGKKMAFYRMDETMVDQYPLLDISTPNHTNANMVRYPEAGKKMHHVSVGVYDLNTFQTVFLEPFTGSEDMYITGITWPAGEREIYTVQLNRAQKHLWVFCHDAESGKIKRTVFEEINDVYVEPEAPIVFRPSYPDQFLWASERSGFNHLYLYSTKGELIKEITPSSEKWEVSSLVSCSEDGKYAYFMGTKDSPLEQNLYSVNIETGEINRLTKESGVHNVRMSLHGEFFLDIYNGTEVPLCYQIIDKNGKVLKELLKSKNPIKDYDLPQVRISTIKAADDTTDLYTRMILPPNFDTTKKYPVIVYVYGGPHAQMITNSWLYGSNLFFYFLAQEGFIIYTVDNRGSNHRGFAFESCTHRRLGDLEMADQMRGVDYLKSLPYVDKERIGVDGWSFGGFMATGLKLKHPGVFKVATAGGPVINWAWYEVMYGERYMDTPDNNPVGYRNSNLLRYVDSLQGKFMLIHGGMDGTVVPKHSLSFIAECIKKNKSVDFFLYPNHEHNVRGVDRRHLYRKLYDYYKANL